MRGEEDDLSDLDIWLFVSDDSLDLVAASLASYCANAGTVVTFGEAPHNAPPNGGYCSALLAGAHGLHHLDIYWQPVSMCADTRAPKLSSGFDWQTAQPIPVPSSAILLTRTPNEFQAFGRAETTTDPSIAPDLRTANCKLQTSLSFIWLMLSIAGKYLARDPLSDMSLLLYAKPSFDEAVAELGLETEIGEIDWSSPSEPAAKVDLLRHIASNTGVLEAACRGEGRQVSPYAYPCLMRYFDLVEAILSHAQH